MNNKFPSLFTKLKQYVYSFIGIGALLIVFGIILVDPVNAYSGFVPQRSKYYTNTTSQGSTTVSRIAQSKYSQTVTQSRYSRFYSARNTSTANTTAPTPRPTSNPTPTPTPVPTYRPTVQPVGIQGLTTSEFLSYNLPGVKTVLLDATNATTENIKKLHDLDYSVVLFTSGYGTDAALAAKAV